MSEHDLKRVEGLSEVESGRRSRAAAASLVGLSERQLYRLLSRYRADGKKVGYKKRPRRFYGPSFEVRTDSLANELSSA
jgi:hypothetical protein